ALNFKELIISIGNLDKSKRPLLGMLEQLYAALASISIPGLPAKDIRHLLFRKLLEAWTSNSWKSISAENIWAELAWDICIQRGISKKEFIGKMEKIRSLFPPSLQVSLEQAKDKTRRTLATFNRKHSLKPVIPRLQRQGSPDIAKTGVPVKNAGLVILNSYIPFLFERLGIVNNKQFLNAEAQEEAVHYLQHLVTGLHTTSEEFLPLNKVLCGLTLSHPVHNSIEISEEYKKMMNGLIAATIGHWPAIGNCSVNGFRGNWLVRDGLLTEQDDKWELTVEKRAYDLLIHKSPFSFSIIKYPWMSKPLHVTWPY
ncbi:MAG TPA: contractile injection system tape measure protein, partial [Bacteroidia bacterium]|nr:contractile injection system tape measure protein [Bacteroidia bacterium]